MSISRERLGRWRRSGLAFGDRQMIDEKRLYSITASTTATRLGLHFTQCACVMEGFALAYRQHKAE